jgi:hypothetical protein
VSLRDSSDIRIQINEDGKWYYWPNTLNQHWKAKKAMAPVRLTPPPPLPPWMR